jgi:hypothetical protein
VLVAIRCRCRSPESISAGADIRKSHAIPAKCERIWRPPEQVFDREQRQRQINPRPARAGRQDRQGHAGEPFVVTTEAGARRHWLRELLKPVSQPMQMSPGVWYWHEGVLHCVGEVAVDRLYVADLDLLAEVEALKQRIAELEQGRG